MVSLKRYRDTKHGIANAMTWYEATAPAGQPEKEKQCAVK